MVKICEVVDGCEDCPKYGDDCDGKEMTREEAVKFLKLMRKAVSYFEEYGHDKASMVIECDKAEAIDMAIEALSLANLKEEFESAEYEDYEHATLVDIKEPLKVLVVRKPIKGYEGYYEVDQFGRVFAKERMIHVTDHDREYDKHLPSRQMKQSVHTKGYKIVPLTKDGVCTTKFVHRLVAEAFIPNPDDLPFVNHIDEDKTNNFVENLEWCTEQYNSTYGKAREKHAKALKGRHHTEEHKKKISDSLKRFYGERRK